jgi:hypothetical protein
MFQTSHHFRQSGMSPGAMNEIVKPGVKRPECEAPHQENNQGVYEHQKGKRHGRAEFVEIQSMKQGVQEINPALGRERVQDGTHRVANGKRQGQGDAGSRWILSHAFLLCVAIAPRRLAEFETYFRLLVLMKATTVPKEARKISFFTEPVLHGLLYWQEERIRNFSTSRRAVLVPKRGN